MAMVTNPVCGMQIDHSQAEARSQHEGQISYFCSNECRQKFEENSKEWLAKS